MLALHDKNALFILLFRRCIWAPEAVTLIYSALHFVRRGRFFLSPMGTFRAECTVYKLALRDRQIAGGKGGRSRGTAANYLGM